ncbi:MAG: hypothetical protein COA96_05575 [SAR86 cluster bacterium]|uniref:Zeta toxin domain-containing protein n=1 Tax=SAR86 cluster bacterium TaxID=2030880 RepID=A0A2A5B3V0_9GAMM|nr:MAG: hypothetical protein COA96_05575 [SAR86 cluster bacterium]
MAQPLPRLRIIAGPNGSGKTNLATSLRRLISFGVYLNPDEFEKSLKQNNSISFTSFSKEITTKKLETHFLNCPQLEKYKNHAAFIRSLKITKRSLTVPHEHINSYVAASLCDYLRKEFIKHKVSFTFETVMSHKSKLVTLKDAKTAGYRTYLYFVSTDRVDINIARIEQRIKEGGHPVSEDKVKRRFKRSMKLLKQAIKLSDRAFIFDNSKERQIWFAEITEGKAIDYKTDDIPIWFNSYVLKSTQSL